MADEIAHTAPRPTVIIENRAACAGYETSVFFPREGDIATVEKAKDVCRRCPALRDCLMQALRIDDRFAILGGTTPSERQLIRRRLAVRQRELGVTS
ncbi:WhiB family transcriptional regulator [Streptomyces sp. NBC_00879]|uniref:WhiB family transcriptional regulator n=1 Tax=Streptomyces sp. NBC_00879 TaxID=2975855 RepID=UPI00386E4A52|nr:WhiB family transcriptional regulator [Streptomyces sp. NBC_00879]